MKYDSFHFFFLKFQSDISQTNFNVQHILIRYTLGTATEFTINILSTDLSHVLAAQWPIMPTKNAITKQLLWEKMCAMTRFYFSFSLSFLLIAAITPHPFFKIKTTGHLQNRTFNVRTTIIDFIKVLIKMLHVICNRCIYPCVSLSVHKCASVGLSLSPLPVCFSTFSIFSIVWQPHTHTSFTNAKVQFINEIIIKFIHCKRY